MNAQIKFENSPSGGIRVIFTTKAGKEVVLGKIEKLNTSDSNFHFKNFNELPPMNAKEMRMIAEKIEWCDQNAR